MTIWTESMEQPGLAVRPTTWMSRWSESLANRFAGPHVDLGLSFGSQGLTLELPGKTFLQPTRVAVDGKGKIVALGQKALEMEGREAEGIRVLRPLRDGVIYDFERARRLLESCLKASGHGLLSPPRLALALQSDLSAVERQTYLDTLRAAGVREVHVVDEALVAAVGAGRPVLEPRGTLVLHLGAGASQAAVLSLGSPVISRTLRLGGDQMNHAIREHVRRAHNLLIDDQVADKVKRELGCARPLDPPRTLEVAGRGLNQGKPVSAVLSSDEIYQVLAPMVAQIVDEARLALGEISPELLRDVVEDGAIMTGGLAHLQHLDEVLSKETRVQVRRSSNPQEAVAKGMRRILQDRHLRRALLLAPGPSLGERASASPSRSGSWVLGLLVVTGAAALSLYFSDTFKHLNPTPVDGLLNSLMKPAITLAAAPENPEEVQQHQDKAMLAERERRIQELAAENKRLWRLFGSSAVSTVPAEVDPLVARVLARDPHGWLAFLTVEAGSDQGVKKGQIVSSSQGLVGQVVMVSPKSCRVRLFTDPDSIVAGLVPSRKSAGVIVGRGGRQLEMRYLDPDSGVKAGDWVVTSGQDGLYPANLPIGRVTRVMHGTDTSFQSVTVEPAVHLDTLREVTLLREGIKG